MKLVKKADLKFDNGYLVNKKGEVFNHMVIVRQFNALMDLVKVIDFVETNKDKAETIACGLPSLDLTAENSKPVFEMPATPAIDAQVMNVVKMVSEKRECQNVDRANELIGTFVELLDFAENDSFAWIETESTQDKFACDPLKLEVDAIKSLVKKYADLEEIVEMFDIKK